MGYDIKEFSHVSLKSDGKLTTPSLIYRISNKISMPLDLTNLNRTVLNLLKQHKYDILWVETCITIFPITLKKIKKQYPDLKMITLSEDDMLLQM